MLFGTTRFHVCDLETGFPCCCVNNRGAFESWIASYANQTITWYVCEPVALVIGSLIRLVWHGTRGLDRAPWQTQSDVYHALDATIRGLRPAFSNRKLASTHSYPLKSVSVMIGRIPMCSCHSRALSYCFVTKLLHLILGVTEIALPQRKIVFSVQ